MTFSDIHSATIPSARDGLSFAELALQLPDPFPPPTELAGDYLGRVVSVAGIQRLPRPIRKPLTRLAAATTSYIWRGKRFRPDGTGVNLFFSMRRPVEIWDYAHQGTTAVPIDYNVPTNHRRFRAVTGHFTDMGPGVILCRMQLNTKKRPYTLMCYTLEQ